MNWNNFALVIASGVLALGVIASWTILIVSGFSDEVPAIYETLLPTLITGGLLGAAFKAGETKAS